MQSQSDNTECCCYMPQDRDATRLIEVSATFRMMSAKGIYVTSSPSLTIPIITTEVLETEQ